MAAEERIGMSPVVMSTRRPRALEGMFSLGPALIFLCGVVRIQDLNGSTLGLVTITQNAFLSFVLMERRLRFRRQGDETALQRQGRPR